MLILVASCAGYSDAWFPFITLFDKYWPDCVYERILYSDPPAQMPCDPGKFQFKGIEDRGWIQNLRDMLVDQTEKVVIVFQEDFFLCYPVDSSLVRRLLLSFEKSGYDGLRLYPCPGADDEKTEVMPGVGMITGAAPYRVSCQLMMWKRNSLIELCDRLLRGGYTRIQQFETAGSTLIDDFKLCGWIRGKTHPSTWPISYLCSAIQAGKWMQGALQLCAEHGIPLSKRDVVLDPSVEQKGFYKWLESCTGATYPMKPVKIKTGK